MASIANIVMTNLHNDLNPTGIRCTTYYLHHYSRYHLIVIKIIIITAFM